MSQAPSSPAFVIGAVRVPFIPDTSEMDKYQRTLEEWAERMKDRLAGMFQPVKDDLSQIQAMLADIGDRTRNFQGIGVRTHEAEPQPGTGRADEYLALGNRILTQIGQVETVVKQIADAPLLQQERT